MSATMLTRQAAYGIAAERTKQGASDAQVLDELADGGIDPSSGRVIVANVRARVDRTPSPRHARRWARRNMLIGGITFAIGLGLTIASYQLMADSPRGGGFTLFWGAMLVGAAQLILGILQYLNK
jgi:hypothetical protein